MAMGLIVYSPYILIQVMVPGLLQQSPDSGMTLAIFNLFLPLVLSPILTAAVTTEVLERQRGGTSTIVRSIRGGLNRIASLLAVNLVVTILTIVGFVLLFVPALIPQVFFVVAIPACVVERQGAMASLNRSVRLTRGARWHILGIVLLFFILAFILYIPLVMLAVVFGMDHPSTMNLLSSFLKVIGATFMAVLVCVIYHELRTKHEGASTDELLEVFS